MPYQRCKEINPWKVMPYELKGEYGRQWWMVWRGVAALVYAQNSADVIVDRILGWLDNDDQVVYNNPSERPQSHSQIGG